MVDKAIESGKKHGIKLEPGRKSRADGNCSYVSVINNINDRPCFLEKLPLSSDINRQFWTTDMKNRILDGRCKWNPGLT